MCGTNVRHEDLWIWKNSILKILESKMIPEADAWGHSKRISWRKWIHASKKSIQPEENLKIEFFGIQMKEMEFKFPARGIESLSTQTGGLALKLAWRLCKRNESVNYQVNEKSFGWLQRNHPPDDGAWNQQILSSSSIEPSHIWIEPFKCWIELAHNSTLFCHSTWKWRCRASLAYSDRSWWPRTVMAHAERQTVEVERKFQIHYYFFMGHKFYVRKVLAY